MINAQKQKTNFILQAILYQLHISYLISQSSYSQQYISYILAPVYNDYTTSYSQPLHSYSSHTPHILPWGIYLYLYYYIAVMYLLVISIGNTFLTLITIITLRTGHQALLAGGGGAGGDTWTLLERNRGLEIWKVSTK